MDSCWVSHLWVLYTKNVAHTRTMSHVLNTPRVPGLNEIYQQWKISKMFNSSARKMLLLHRDRTQPWPQRPDLCVDVNANFQHICSRQSEFLVCKNTTVYILFGYFWLDKFVRQGDIPFFINRNKFPGIHSKQYRFLKKNLVLLPCNHGKNPARVLQGLHGNIVLKGSF